MRRTKEIQDGGTEARVPKLPGVWLQSCQQAWRKCFPSVWEVAGSRVGSAQPAPGLLGMSLSSQGTVVRGVISAVRI